MRKSAPKIPTVKAVNSCDFPLNGPVCKGCGIDSEIPSFGMSAQKNSFRLFPLRLLFQVEQSPLLEGTLSPAGHVEILFPSDDMIVRTAVCDINAAVLRGKCHGGELAFLLLVEITLIIRHRNSEKRADTARRYSSFGARASMENRPGCFGGHIMPLIQLCQPLQRHLLPAVKIREDSLRRQIGQNRKDETVRRAEGYV